MKIVALISGGKDSCFNMMHCVAQGHEIVALANLQPDGKDELDSYMFQTVGHDVIDLYSEAIGLPLYRGIIKGKSLNVNQSYQLEVGDEVEDLYELLKTIQEHILFDAVSSGAILSNYQRERVEDVCRRLGLQSLAYLWQRDQVELLNEMIDSGVVAILIKTASLGLIPCKHLGKTLNEMQNELLHMNKKYELNVCGEGGEYETLTLDCPLFVKKICIDELKIVIHSDDAFAQVGYLTFQNLHLEDKGIDTNILLKDRLKDIVMPLLPSLNPFNVDNFVDTLSSNGRSSATAGENSHDIQHSQSNNRMEMVILNVSNKAFVGDIVCCREEECTIQESVTKTFEKFQHLIASNGGYRITDVSLVHLFIADMSQFSVINTVYKEYFQFHPAARVCIEANLPKDLIFKMDAVIDATSLNKDVLHVQSISYWAPANIGPYSQCVHVGDTIYFSGSIGMIPATLKVLHSDFIQEAYLALYHVKTVSNAKLHRTVCESYGKGNITCYITDKQNFSILEEFFKFQPLFDSNQYHLDVICVPRLPRNANVEWHVQSTDESFVLFKTNNDNDYDTDDSGREDADFKEEIKSNFSILLSAEELLKEDDFLMESIREDAVNFQYCRFMRVYYIPTENNIEKTLRNLFQKVTSWCFEKPVFSFVPVTAIKFGKILLIQGHCWKGT